MTGKGDIMKKGCLICGVVLLSSLLLLCGCHKKEPSKPPSAAELISQGWAKFGAGDDAGAIGDFNAAMGLTADTNDAYLGLGWAELRQSQAGLAEEAFVTYLAKYPNQIDAEAGLAIAYHAVSKPQDAIDQANAVLSSAPTWSFSHDSRANYLDLALVLADSYYEIGEFSQSLTVVQHYFDSGFNPDLSTDSGRAQLAAKLDSLYTG
jgi:tetratricopeptide (TPR) repeat protein